MENINYNKDFSSNIKYIRGLRNIIKYSLNKNQNQNFNNNNKILDINSDSINVNANYKIGANITNSDNQNSPNKTDNNNNIEKIEIKTNFKNSKTYISNTTPHPIYKNNKKFGLVRLNIKNKLFSNSKDKYSNYNTFYKIQFDNTIEQYKRKSFSHSFRNISKYNINEENGKVIDIKNQLKRNNIPKININAINNINYDSINKINLIKKKYNNFNNNNNGITKIINNTFEAQNDGLLNFTEVINRNNDSKFKKIDLETEIKMKIKENKEIKQNILLMWEEINKIKERQDKIFNYENENQIKNKERNIKISNIIKKTYNFLNDFYKIINEQNCQIYQEIINNLNSFFN